MRVYLDYCASAPLRPAAAAAWAEAAADAGNPSSVHAAGARARAHVDRARAALAVSLGVAPETLCFTSGATESNNAVLLGIAARGERDELLVSATEHASVLEPARVRGDRDLALRELPVDAQGRIDGARYAEQLCSRTRLVCAAWVNAETGVIQPVAELARRAREAGALFHCDATQALGAVPLDLEASGVDFASFSAHKLGAAQGVGALYVRPGCELAPLLRGGDQEAGRRAGTPAVAAIASFGAVCGALAEGGGREAGHLAALRDRLWEGIAERIGGVQRVPAGPGAPPVAPHVLQVCFEGAPGDLLVEALDLEGIAVSSGSACRAGSSEPSHVLRAMGVDPERARCAVRFSVGAGNDAEQIDAVLARLPALVDRVRRAERGTPA